MDNSHSHPENSEHILQQSLSQPLLLTGRHSSSSHGFRPSSSAGDVSLDGARVKLGSAGSLRRSVASHFAAASSPSSTSAARSSHSSRLQLAASVYTSRTLRPSTGPLRVTHSSGSPLSDCQTPTPPAFPRNRDNVGWQQQHQQQQKQQQQQQQQQRYSYAYETQQEQYKQHLEQQQQMLLQHRVPIGNRPPPQSHHAQQQQQEHQQQQLQPPPHQQQQHQLRSPQQSHQLQQTSSRNTSIEPWASTAVEGSSASRGRVGSAVPRTHVQSYLTERSNTNALLRSKTVQSAGKRRQQTSRNSGAEAGSGGAFGSLLFQEAESGEADNHPWSWVRDYQRPPSRQLPPELALFLDNHPDDVNTSRQPSPHNCSDAGSTSETASSRPATADAKDDESLRDVSATGSTALRWLPEYNIVPSVADRGSLRTAAVEYLVDDDDELHGSSSGACDVRRPHTSATPGGRGGANLRPTSAGISIRSNAQQREPDVLVVDDFPATDLVACSGALEDEADDSNVNDGDRHARQAIAAAVDSQQHAPTSPVSRRKFALQAENLDIKEDTEEGDGAENDFNRVALAMPKTGFKERRRPSSAAEIAAVSVRDNLFWVRPPSRQLPPPEALHLNAPRKQDEARSAGVEGHGPERRRSNSAIGIWSTMFDALKRGQVTHATSSSSKSNIAISSQKASAVGDCESGKGVGLTRPLSAAKIRIGTPNSMCAQPHDNSSRRAISTSYTRSAPQVVAPMRCATASSKGFEEGVGFGSVAPDEDFDYATIHGDPMGGCSESSEDEESAPITFSRH